MSTYRVDYATEADPDTPIIVTGLSRQGAMRVARKLSVTHGTAYAIRSDYGRFLEPGRMKDVGQRVYVSGYYSHTDDEF